jgi:uncharacterized protein YutE (UPF0331/DUF86 family)
MNPIRLDVIEKKRRIILDEIKVLKEAQRLYQADGSNSIVEHALMHAMQNCISAIIDIAQHVTSEKLGRAPESYSEAIRDLGGVGVLEPTFADKFARVAKLRNVLVHLYDSVDIAFLFSLVPMFIKDTTTFLKALDGVAQ